MSKEISRHVVELARLLNRKNWKMAAAESCTGGWISKVCTDLDGSSAWFERGFVTYSNEAKMELLGVLHATLDQYGAVSEETAAEMAFGARQSSPVQVSVAVTGIAGPTGGSTDKPVGTVWFGWAVEGQGVQTEQLCFDGDRNDVRRQTVIHALEGLIKRLNGAFGDI